MQAPNLQAKSARPASPVSSGSTGSFSNKRRKLDLSDTLLGLAKGTTAWQTSQPAVHSDQLPTKQLQRPVVNNSNAGLASDADSDACEAFQNCHAASNLAQAALGSCHFDDQHMSTAAPDLLTSTEQLPTEADDPADVEHGSAWSDQSPVDDDSSSGASVPLCPIKHRYKQAKGKVCVGPSPLPRYDPQQESKLDHIRMGNWVWWKIDSTWTFARVRKHSVDMIVVVIELKRMLSAMTIKELIKQGHQVLHGHRTCL